MFMSHYATEVCKCPQMAQWQRDYAKLLVKADSKVQMAQARSGHKRSAILGNGLLGLGKLFDNAGDLIHRYFDEKI